MRESRKGEKTHLPRDSYEEWSEAQTAKLIAIKHRKAPKNTYKARVVKRPKKVKRARKKA
ncbi:MAG: hypothetical protein LYZ69_05905 [Nitrososphaerales archaeon]|nr:hypothetical protein [Nitrososphaerales archaeon]